MCERFPAFAGGWEAGSFVAQRLGNLPKALEYIERALALEPQHPLLHLRRARVLLQMSRHGEALRVAEAVATLAPADPAVLAQLAGFHTAANDHARALPFYREARRLDPSDAGVCFNLAATERFVGNIDAAEAAYEAGLRLRPAHHEARYLRAGLRRQTPERNHVAELEGLLAGIGDDWFGEAQLCYALAKEYEDLGEYERSFATLQRGGARRRANMRYDVADDEAAVDAIIASFAAPLSEAPSGHPSAEPIFVLGLPRTGTTLVERILSSHPQVSSAGELNHFAIEMTRAVRATGRPAADKLQMIEAAPTIDFAQLGERYVASTRPLTGHRAHFIDKMPLNYLYCGLIARALPQARIIELVRHPLDTCLSVYKQWFTMAYPFSYDLDDLGRYYLAYLRLMQHWHRTMPGRILRVRYEDLIADQTGQTRRMLEHCGLAWDDACLAFERNENASTTASAVQVRQKLYSSAVDRWTHYAQALAPLADAIKASPDYQAAELGYPL
nr:tetratricopeptide repeat-containing sulfotransferase family protein [Solimonas marina]